MLTLMFRGTGDGVTKIAARMETERFHEETVTMIPGVDIKTAVIEVGGLISFGTGYGPGNAAFLAAQIRRAMLDPKVVAVVLDINSPGGEITAVDEIHHMIRELAGKDKPVVSVMRSVGASGAYYIAAASDYIIANPMTITGSIGVIIPRLEYTELLRKIGVEYSPYKSGELKDLLSGGIEHEDEKQAEIDAHLQSMVDAGLQRFAEAVAWGRSRYEDAAEVIGSEFSDGRIMSGEQAYELGLVDRLGYFDEGLMKARELAGVAETNTVRYRRPWRWRDLWLMGGGETNLLKIDAGSLLESSQGLYFLMPGL